MNDVLPLAIAGVAGLALGVIFFGGLWLTVNRGAASERPALWFIGSLLLRMSVVISGFYFVSGGHWQRLLTCLVGFAVARHIVMRLTRSPEEAQGHLAGEASHAP